MLTYPGIVPSDILLPRAGTDLAKWAVVACDQYTAQPEYWRRAEAFVGDAPSTLKMVLPEAYLHKDNRDAADRINREMRARLNDGTLTEAVKQGFVLVKRETRSGARMGLMAALDLNDYDFAPGTRALTRATEGTILSRIPPRAAIRRDAPLECPHVMLLIDDPDDTVLGPLTDARASLRALYDFELMENGGHLSGWAVETEDALNALSRALNALHARADGFLYAVGDGNHSLATAKALWDAQKGEDGPARYALVEIVNLHSPALVFEPIHRVLFGADRDDVIRSFRRYLALHGQTLAPGAAFTFLAGDQSASFCVPEARDALPAAVIQPFLDEYLAARPEASIDYIHGGEAVRTLAQAPRVTGVLLPAMDKSRLFPAIRSGGVLPRKTFSMGEANEKRYYMECRLLKGDGCARR